MGIFDDGLFGLGGLGGLSRTDNEFRDVDPTGQLAGVATEAQQFGGLGRRGFNRLTGELDEDRGFLRGLQRGEQSISAEQLRQGLQQQLAAQQAAAAGARPQNAAAAARTASINAARAGSGLAGQQALAGLAERQAAGQQLANLNLGQRQQNLQAALGGQQGALQGFGNIEQLRGQRFQTIAGDPTTKEKILGGLTGALTDLISDKRLKTDIEPGDDDAQQFLRGLKAYRYKYRNAEHGKGDQLGVMAQDLERTRLGRQAVINAPGGKMVHGAKLVGALAAASASMNKRLEKLEKRG